MNELDILSPVVSMTSNPVRACLFISICLSTPYYLKENLKTVYLRPLRGPSPDTLGFLLHARGVVPREEGVDTAPTDRDLDDGAYLRRWGVPLTMGCAFDDGVYL